MRCPACEREPDSVGLATMKLAWPHGLTVAIGPVCAVCCAQMIATMISCVDYDAAPAVSFDPVR